MVTYRLDLNGQLLKTTLVSGAVGGTSLTSMDLTQDGGNPSLSANQLDAPP
jgi:hypothetical protein